MSAAQQWADDLDSWGIPQAILDAAPESPWFHDPAAFAVDDSVPRDSVSARMAREALQPSGTVLDVGCGGGRSSLALVPEALHVNGVDTAQHMLDSFAASAKDAGVGFRTVLGSWPDVASRVSPADVVVCHHVLYNVKPIVPFLRALTDHARRRVVVEVTTVHPTSGLNEAWLHFHGLTRPAKPTWHGLVAVGHEMGLEVNVEVSLRHPYSTAAVDPARQVPFVRRRLCLPMSREPEIAEWLAEHPIRNPTEVATLWWPGTAQA